MNTQSRLEGKRILVVDDEEDVLETLVALLDICRVTTATTFEEAEKLLKSRPFDMTILDIMGVKGYELLDIAKEKGVTAVMLTAHALTVNDTVKSFKKGAAFYVPKEKMANLPVYLEDVFEGIKKGKRFWWRWLDRMGPYYDERFGDEWRDKNKKFLEGLKYRV
ncbi:response regulator receiver domain protein [delta proteobacterium NaphS2]|nr:response regulator receiver domain protein [delta proteobacterium NaphS2]